MIRGIHGRLSQADREAGVTLVELLVASMMSVILVGAASSMIISAVRDQPALSKKSQNVTTARWQLERIVRDLRNGEQLEVMTASQVRMIALVRRASCGGSPQSDLEADAIPCRVQYSCSGDTCTRAEGPPAEGASVGTPRPALTGIENPDEVFCFVPSTAPDPTECGPAGTNPTCVGVQLEVPNPDGPGHLSIADGASLRTAVFNRVASE
jgi:hypothetical protein